MTTSTPLYVSQRYDCAVTVDGGLMSHADSMVGICCLEDSKYPR